MSSKIQSHSIKLLLALMLLCCIPIMFFYLPSISQVPDYDEMAHLATPMLIASEFVMLCFIVGLGAIMYLLILFDHDSVFTPKFTKTLNLLALLCLIVGIILSIILLILIKYGGPGPGGIFILMTIVAIFIAGNAFNLFAKVISQATRYKEENELTV